MPISFSPSLIIFVNDDLTTSVQDTFTRQFYLSEKPMTAAEFDLRVFNDPGYQHIVHLNFLRIMVMRNLRDQTNRELADIVLFFKNGLVAVEHNKYGPPNTTLPLDRCYLSELVDINCFAKCHCKCGPNLFNQFVGQPSGCFDFNPNEIFPCMVPEPIDDIDDRD